jgi:hypothetical protein
MTQAEKIQASLKYWDNIPSLECTFLQDLQYKQVLSPQQEKTLNAIYNRTPKL